jgi:propanol-preferring alcohol dehydrogenase
VALFGFGSSAHLAIQVLRHWGCEVFALTRGERHRALARKLGAEWVGAADDLPPETCDRAVVFAPVGDLVPVALRAVRPGGTVSLAGIYMSPIPVMDYALLWRERSLRSVANVTRRDAEEFVALAVEANVRAEFETYPLAAANDALAAVAADSVRGSAVLEVS